MGQNGRNRTKVEYLERPTVNFFREVAQSCFETLTSSD